VSFRGYVWQALVREVYISCISSSLDLTEYLDRRYSEKFQRDANFDGSEMRLPLAQPEYTGAVVGGRYGWPLSGMKTDNKGDDRRN